MKADKSRVTSKGQLVIPARLRRRFEIKKGTLICFIGDCGRIIVQPVTREFIRGLRGSLKGEPSASCARGEKAAGEKLKEIAQLPIDLVGVDMELAELAATPMAEHNLPYADYFAAALARLGKAMLVTADRDFAIVKEILGIVWPFQAFPLTAVIQSDMGLL